MNAFNLARPRSRNRKATRPSASRRSEAGFTLVELLVVMAILALLASLVAPRVLGYLGSSRTKAAKLQIENIATSLQLFKLDTGRYPKTHEGIAVLVKNSGGDRNWNGPYLEGGKVPRDPWGNAFRYRYPGRHAEFDIYSFGADNRQGGDGEDKDVTSW
ncbi:MAG: type II secretion system major pseudopilin GspG [Methyloligellaceae bacterium]